MRSIISDVSTSVQRVVAQQPPPILAALETLGVTVETIYKRLHFSNASSVSLWRTSANKIPPKHHHKLVAMLREAVDATRELAEQIDEYGAGRPGELAELRRRIEMAESVLREADDGRAR